MRRADGHLWWQRGVVYQIYPRSFLDSDGDGAGDLRGIVSRLDYLEWLGVDAVWISPFYPSPMADFGYDITDHTDVHPLFGTLEDFDDLVAEAHRRRIRVILDYVPNHTSEQHPWFVESRSSRDSPKRDWYIWRDPAPDGGPPNNWIDTFGIGSAWAWDEGTGQYYYHAHLEEQPDLNWRNPEVREAMYGVLRFWLERGVDGFRVDALRHLIKDDLFRDNPPNPAFGPEDRPFDALLPVYNTDRREIAAFVAAYEAALPSDAWPSWVLGNHDRSRVASRVGPAQARVAAMLLLTLRGTPTLYYGDEIWMHDVPVPPGLVQDPFGKNVPRLGRDPARTPMQWDSRPHAGFTSGTPWLPVADDYREINVAAERKDPKSMLALHRRLLALRRAEPALATGSYTPLEAAGDLLAYRRQKGGRRFLVALNLGARPQTFVRDDMDGRISLSTHLDRDGEKTAGTLELRGGEGVIVDLG
jgi:alpha-glucosidase